MIKPEVLYEESELQHHLAGAFGPLTVARKDGKVKHIHAHYSTFYLGSDVIDWLKSIGTPKTEAKSSESEPATEAKSTTTIKTAPATAPAKS